MHRWIALTVVLFLVPAGVAPGGEGERDLKEVFDRVPLVGTSGDLIGRYPIAAYEQLLELMDSGARFVGEDAYRAAERNLQDTLDHLARLASDPAYRDEYALRRFVHVHPVLSKFEVQVVARPPHYLFVECAESGLPAETYARYLGALHAMFRDLFAERFDLPELGGREDPTERTLKFFVFRKPGSFDAYQEAIRLRLPRRVGAYYMPADQWVLINEDGAEGVDANLRHRILHDAVHQLMHLYTKVGMERESGREVLWGDDRTHSRSLWFQEGLAEFLGATNEREDGSLEFLVPLAARVAELESSPRSGVRAWSLRELLKIRTSPELTRVAAVKGLGRQAQVLSLFYAQAWKWVHFLWFFEEGKYREKLLGCMESELAGVSGPDVFEKLWFGEEQPDWSAVEREWAAYMPR